MRKRRFWLAIGISLAVLLLMLLVGPFLVPVPPLLGLVPPRQLADSDSQFVEINGVSVHVKTAGEGQTAIVLLHGFGASLYSWQEVMESLGQYGRVIAYDRVAFGLTERPMDWGDPNPYSSQAAVDLLQGVLDTFHVDRAILVGNSAGGTVAMQYTLQHPDRVEALILVDAAVYEGGGGPSWLRPLYKTPQMQHLGPLIARQIQKYGLELIDMAWHDPSRLGAETLELYEKPLMVENWDRALWFFTTYSEPGDLQQRLSEFTLPVLVITGDDDRVVPTEFSIRLADELPEATLVVISEAGHVPHEEQPAAFLQAVDEFLR